MSTTDSVCHWLAATQLSQLIAGKAWIVPAVQTIHILTVAAVMIAVLMFNLGLIRSQASGPPMRWIKETFLPVLWWSFPLLAVTGGTLIIGEPARTLKNPVFYLKMALLVSGIALTLIALQPLRLDTSYWHRPGSRRWGAWSIASASLLTFAAIVFSGRWIAYVQGE